MLKLLVEDRPTQTFLGVVFSLLLILGLFVWYINFQQNSYLYEIGVGANTYYCNEYRIEDNKLYLEDCNTEDTVIRNPVNYRIEER